MNKIYKVHNQKCLDINNDLNLASLQIKTVPIAAGLHIPAMLLFSRLIRGLLSQMNK